MDWPAFLDSHRISYSDRGPSTAKDNIYIPCPWCGDQEPRMGISIKGKGWGCWRSATHRGKAPHRLIQALLGCSWEEANRLAGRAADRAIGGDLGLSGAVQSAFAMGSHAPSEAPALTLPESFKKLASRQAISYLNGRGLSDGGITTVIDTFNLMEARTDRDWAYRIIFPINDRAGELQTWTGRAISDQAKQRYKTLTTDPDKAGGGSLAKAPITNCLLSADRLEGGEYLLIGEGPFDAANLKAGLGDRADTSCLFGKAISAAQLDLLAILRPRYAYMILLLDPDAWIDSLRMARQELSALGVIPFRMEGDSDPGELTRLQTHKLLALIEKSLGLTIKSNLP